MDATVLGRTRLQVRGGVLRIASGEAAGATLTIDTEKRIVGRGSQCDLVLPDRRVSAVHLEVVATAVGVSVRDVGSTNGTHIGNTRLGHAFLTKKETLVCGDTKLEFRPTEPEEHRIAREDSFGPLAGATVKMRDLFERLKKVAPTDLSVLILGETGTGKEVAARAIHEASKRAKKPFEVVDCAGLPPSLAESALFGHERGAFTGAVDRRVSPFVLADGGTVFLDELGELPIDVQPKLLRVLAERRVKAVGASAYRDVDVRVIAATRRNLTEEINERRFRDDLYFRIAQVRVELPALRERIADVPLLVRRVLKDLGDEGAFKRVTRASLELLARHDWSGNVRELRNVVAVGLATAEAGEDIELAVGGTNGIEHATFRAFSEQRDREYWETLFARTQGNVSEMARKADIGRFAVRHHLTRLGIAEPRPRKKGRAR